MIRRILLALLLVSSCPAAITFSSASLNSAGTTVSVTLAGCASGTCTPASGVNNFRVCAGGSCASTGVVVFQSAATISGSTVTITLNSEILSSETVTIDLLSSGCIWGACNLTDGSSSTVTQSTGNAVTNGSTVSGALLNSGFSTTTATTTAFITQWDAAGGSPTHTHTAGSQALISTVAHCSSLDMYTYFGGQWKAIIDGSAGSTQNPGIGVWGWYTVYSGKTDANHTTDLQNAGDFWFVTGQNNLRCVSSATGLSLESADYAQQYLPTQTGVVLDGSPGTGSGGNYATDANWATNSGQSGVSGLRFTTSSPSMTLFGYFSDLTSLQIRQDGGAPTTVSVTNGSGVRSVVQIFSGQTGAHTYEVTPYNDSAVSGSGDASGRSDWHLDGILVPSGQTISASGPSTRVTVGCIGDSICWGSDGTTPTTTNDIEGWKLTRTTLNMGTYKQGFPGACVATTTCNGTAIYQQTAYLNVSPAAGAIIFSGGVNDERNAVTIGDKITSGTFIYGMYNMLLNACSSISPATSAFLVRAILPYGEASSSTRPTYIAAQQSAVNSYNTDKSAGCPTAYYYDTTNWFNGTTGTGDLVHPNPASQTLMANLDTPVISSHISTFGYAYTLSCPGSGSASIGVAVTCTVALTGGATWTALSVGNSPAETLSCSASGISGTFNKSFPWNPTAGGNSDTFTFTPTGAGTGTVSCTNGQDAWVDPAAVSFTASSSFTANPSVIMVP